MSEWNFAEFAAKKNLLARLRVEAERFFALVAEEGVWERGTAAGDWQVRDVAGHLLDVTEGYLAAFADGGAVPEAPYGLAGMAARCDERARRFRSVARDDLLDRLRGAYGAMMEIFEGLGEGDWAGRTVFHFYMGPLPAYFYPAFQLADYAVHSWDVREGSGRGHALSRESADLLVPVVFGLWQNTAKPGAGLQGSAVRVRVLNGENRGDHALAADGSGALVASAEGAGADGLVEFDAASLVLTGFGRVNAGSASGDGGAVDELLDRFFRI
ncbi:hypothetical protein GCM10027589_15280 [Actinocorallia lasiicapitis]